jgi:hypothetical protein
MSRAAGRSELRDRLGQFEAPAPPGAAVLFVRMMMSWPVTLYARQNASPRRCSTGGSPGAAALEAGLRCIHATFRMCGVVITVPEGAIADCHPGERPAR